MDKPQIGAAVGLAWRPRKHGWAAVWICRQDLAKKGFRPATHQIGVYTNPPTEDEAKAIAGQCERLQEEMYAFGNVQPKVFAGTVRALINAYQTDKDSPYQTARWHSRQGFDSLLRRLDSTHGDKRLADLGARDFKHLYESTRWPDGKDGKDKISSAHHIITVVRMMLSFGYSFEIEKAPAGILSQCARLKLILHEMKFEKGGGGGEALTLRQCEDIIAAANARGMHSVALAQAFQFDLGARQKDIVGEYVPQSEPGISSVTYHGLKWLRGLRWEEISSGMILTHKISKSRKGKVLEVDLNNHPMIMAELMKIQPEKRTGPVIISERTRRPWRQASFRGEWRKIANQCGIPASVKNMHSRAGRVTETLEATDGNLDAARIQAGHSDVKTTMGYRKRQLESNTKTAATVTAFRAREKLK